MYLFFKKINLIFFQLATVFSKSRTSLLLNVKKVIIRVPSFVAKPNPWLKK